MATLELNVRRVIAGLLLQQHDRLHDVTEHHHRHSQHGSVISWRFLFEPCDFQVIPHLLNALLLFSTLAEKYNFLGISIVGQSNERGDGGIYIGSIMKGGAVAADGRIEPGDMLLQVRKTLSDGFPLCSSF